MRPRLAFPFLAVLVFTITGCDLMSDPEGPQPEDFEAKDDTSEVRATEPGEKVDAIRKAEVPQDVASPLSPARGAITLSINVPR